MPLRTSSAPAAVMEALQAGQPDDALAANSQLYGQFVGSWRLDVELIPLGVRAEGEALFAWVLDGSAVQDLFIIPARHLRAGPRQSWWRYGSTVRWYDPAIDAWRITFFDPARSVEMRLIGRQAGDDIVHVGEEASGLLRRWRFSNITGTSFLWLGEVSWDRGANWTLELRMAATRRT